MLPVSRLHPLTLALLLLVTPAAAAPGPAAGSGWSRVPLVDAATLAAGARFGGEGCQWPYDVQLDPIDGAFGLFTTDVGGMWRTLDGGETWEPCNVGHTPRGSSAVRIDPHFPTRVLSDGMNSGASPVNGLYLSEDRAASWRPVFTASIANHTDRRQKIAWDPTTRDDAAGLTRVVYWSRTDEPSGERWGEYELSPGLYRSDDGGRSWTRLDDAACEAAGRSSLAVNPASGRLLAGNPNGVFVSDDRGETFRRVLDRPCTSLDASAADPGVIWMTRPDGVMVSRDGGERWEEVSLAGVGGTDRQNIEFKHLAVSPADPGRVLVTSTADDYRFLRHATHDGGTTWVDASVESGGAFMPQNARQGVYGWHPTDPDRVLSFGGDWPTASDDGGKSFRWSGDGQNAIYVAGKFSFNAHHPGLLFLPSQDYNGAVTRDGGKTWSYTPVSGFEWGGFCYGGLAISPEVVVTGLSTGGWGSPRVLQRSTDGGATWSAVPGAPTWTQDTRRDDYGYDNGFSSPFDAGVAFAGPLRTQDGGKTWERMIGCSGVYAADDAGRLFGGFQRVDAAEADLVRSIDGGKTWETLVALPGSPEDLAVTPDGTRVYLAFYDRLWKFLPDADRSAVIGNPLLLVDTPPTGTGKTKIKTVAVDPRDGETIFAGQRVDQHTADVGVLRSTDGGATWENLNLTEPLDGVRLDGGREPQTLRVDPQSGDLLVTTGCFGVWRYRDEAR